MATIAVSPPVPARLSPFLSRRTITVLQGAFVYVVAFAILWWVTTASPGFLSTDDYYHARISEEIILQGRLALNFPWLPHSMLSPDKYVDHHMLYHMVLAPAVYWWGATGAKAVTTAIAALIFLTTWVLLRQIGVRHATLWTFGLFAMSATFILRMLMIRAPGSSFVFMTLMLIVFLRRKNYVWLVPICFFFAWLYSTGAGVLIASFTAAYLAAVWFAERRIEWKAAAYGIAGFALGEIINPYFPRNIVFILDNLGPKVDLANSIPVGQEWYPFSTRTWLTALSGSVAAMAAGFVRPMFGGKRDVAETTLMLCALITAFMAFQSMRFLEYFPGFALTFAAASWGRDPVIQIHWPPLNRFKRFLIPVVLVALLLGFGYPIMKTTYALSQDARPPEEYQGSAEWLLLNTAPGTMIFPVGFNDFSRLFYFNQQNTYLIGLDPTFLSYVDPREWDVYDDIRQGRVVPSEAIAGTFGLQYIVSSRDRHPAFNRRASNDPNMEIAFQDEYTYVWKIKPEAFARLTPASP